MDSKSLKILDIQIQEVGAKRRLNSTSKVNTHTDTHTNTQTHIWTFQLIESIGLKKNLRRTDRRTLRLLDQRGPRADSVKKLIS